MTSSSRMGIAHKPAELFRSDLISAMKLPDSLQMESSSYLTIKETWRREWEFGVQVCVSPEQMPKPTTRVIGDPPARSNDFRMPPTHFTEHNTDSQYSEYDLDDVDLSWLEQVNQQRRFRALAGSEGLSEESFREAIIALETKCQQNMACAVATEVSLGIEYDEGTVCDICRDRESEDTNDMIFCDSCNVCVHQACYGVPSIPKGKWLCKTCSVGEREAKCVLCFNSGGALKRVRPGNTSWAHLSCALWIPEVRVGNADKMEPITNIEDIPPSRWNLVCCVCRRKQGACIQCSHPSCATAYHITCAFQNGLETHSRLDIRTNSVIHESYCPKHTPLHRSPSKLNTNSPHKNHMNRFSQLQQVRDQFFTYVTVDDLSTSVGLPVKMCALIYNYWKLKRKSLHNRPLLSHLPIETASVGLKAELALSRQYGLSQDENFLKIINVRQNLEKARNLVYMVQKRERLKKRLLDSQQQIFSLQSTLLEEEAEQERERREQEEKEEMEAQLSVRKTRSMTQKIESTPENPTHPQLTPPPTPGQRPLSPSHIATCNHIPNSLPGSLNSSLNTPPLNGPSSDALFVENEATSNCLDIDHMTSHAGHMTLRSRDTQNATPSTRQLFISLESSHLIRPKMKHANGECSPPMGRTFGSNQDELVLRTSPTDGPARNLRFRPYTLNKT